MSSWNCRREQERQKREKHLQQKVQDTLCLPPPPLPTQAHQTYSPSPEEQKETVRQYKSKLRINRILQVRAQEALLASKRVSQFRDHKANDSKMLLNQLKDVWRNDQLRCIASLEEEFAKSCKSIGVGHDAALLVERDRVAKKDFAARQAEESRCWDTLRFEEALHKSAECAPTLRRQIVENLSNVERSNSRRYNHGARPKPHEQQAYGCSKTVNSLVNHDVVQEKLNDKFAGGPIDFKDTHMHSRFDVQNGLLNCPSAVVSFPGREKIDAWRAADARRESVKLEMAHQMELEKLLSERQLERGNAATAKLLNDKRIAMLEHEVEEAFRIEEREKDRLLAFVNPGFFKWDISAGQRSRIIYTKHKISNPLSCPGLPHTSRTCSRCRSCVELVSPPSMPAYEEPFPEFDIECEHDAENINISSCVDECHKFWRPESHQFNEIDDSYYKFPGRPRGED